jgi:hypothetical protein
LEYQHTYTTETSVRLKDPKIEYQPIDKSEWFLKALISDWTRWVYKKAVVISCKIELKINPRTYLKITS